METADAVASVEAPADYSEKELQKLRKAALKSLRAKEKVWTAV